MSESVSALDRSRRRLLFWFAVAFVAWQLPTIADNALGGELGRAGSGFVGLAALAGMLFWLVVAWRLLRLMQRVDGRPEVSGALNDERVRANRNRAIWTGFFTLVTYLALARAGSLLLDVSVAVVLDVGIVLAVVVPISAYLFMERGDDE